MEKKRSIGVTLFGWVIIMASAFHFVTAVISTIQGISSKIEEIPSRILIPHIAFNLLLHMFLGVFLIILGLNILRLKSWARKTIICMSGIALISGVLAIIIPLLVSRRTILPSDVALIPMIIISGFPLFFFTRSKIKEQFTK